MKWKFEWRRCKSGRDMKIYQEFERENSKDEAMQRDVK
jgi:hypothetical protein